MTLTAEPRARRTTAAVVVVALLSALAVLSPPLDPPASAREGAAHVSDDVIERLDAGESAVVIVMAARERPAQARDAMAAHVEPIVGPVGRFSRIGAITATIDSHDQLDAILRDPAVTSVTLGDRVASRSLAESRVIVGADVAHAAGFRGAGTTVAIVDSGVEATHDDIETSLTYEACFINPPDNVGYCPGGTFFAAGPGSAPDDSTAHGTAMSAVVTGDGLKAPVGIAPDANLEMYKIFEDNNGGLLTDLILALENIANRNTADVVTLSLEFASLYLDTCDGDFPALSAAVAELRALDIVVIAAAGNGGIDAMAAPACIDDVVSVAATVDDATLPDFGSVSLLSNVSAETDLAAPGEAVITATTNNKIAEASGSSLAAATAAGCAALLRQGGLSTAASIEGRLAVSPVQASSVLGRSLPLVNCPVGAPYADGEVSCNGVTDALDALFISQHRVGLRTDIGTCPLDPGTQVNLSNADVTADGQVDLLDALLIVQCQVGLLRWQCGSLP